MFLKPYNFTPTKNPVTISVVTGFLWWWDSKGRYQSAERGKKVSGGHFFSPWENPLLHRRTPCGCGYEVI